ncbi:ATP-binding protein [Schinkia azotoformans]|uniref:ATP-binding protein n=1 Tax=Schinkia azotoformans TaxID=1454 RepID=UPI002DB6AAF9|nr:ATP-binding protein [Schinkia azotoformans]MEC1722371.1 ATP-binding protein [Schinkia azotoformans]MED4411731.1 ATP-binding protein [Schinkia azotoformans]
MRAVRSNEVFNPGAFPKHTYVIRKSLDTRFTYEYRLEQALHTVGFLTSIIGPSKTGKTVLVEKVVGIDKRVLLTGSDFKNANDFWEVVAKKVGLSMEGDLINTNTTQGTGVADNIEKRSTTTKQKFFTGKDKVIDYFKQNNKVLVLDDFHYAPEEIQYDIAYQLKDAIRLELKAIVISLPHRTDDAIRKNPDLSGRLNLISIEPWRIEELEEIATTGFNKLGIKVSDDIVTNLAQESLTSPQLMQSICFNISFYLNIDENEEIDSITDKSVLKDAYNLITVNLPYSEVVKKLEDGPNPRGQKRKTYALTTGENIDIYSLLIKAIAEDPPITSISLDEIKRRTDLLIGSNDKPDRNKVKNTIEQAFSIIKASDAFYQVFEWKDNQIYILEPLFLFYLRWGTHI